MSRTTLGFGASSSLSSRTGGIARWLGAIFLALTLAACGGSDHNNNSSSSGSSGSGGSSSGSGSSGSSGSTSGATTQPISPTNTNSVPITVNAGAANFVNIPNVSVTVCAPGTNNCQTINNIQLDTASFGLRLVNSAAASVVGSLPVSAASNGGQLAECASFADGYTWGTVRSADVKMGSEVASNIPVQIIGDLDSSTAPTGMNGCPSGNDENTVAEIGANGILGVGTATYDCGTACVSSALNAQYFSCSGTTCSNIAAPLAQQVVNPVTRFAADNNGVIVQLPPIADNGAPSASGTLIFGIGTQSNNALASVTKFGTDGFGDLTGTYKGTTYQTFFDTGSNGNFFQDTFALCSSTSAFYCPSSEQSLSAVITGSEGNTTTVPFNLVSARTLTSSGSNFAFNSLGGQLGMSGLFDFGLPFFYGRHVYVGYDLTGSSPYVAF